jgi:hypothetical protein
LNWGLCTCKAGILPLQPHLQSICSDYFGDGSQELFSWAGLEAQSSQSQPPK